MLESSQGKYRGAVSFELIQFPGECKGQAASVPELIGRRPLGITRHLITLSLGTCSLCFRYRAPAPSVPGTLPVQRPSVLPSPNNKGPVFFCGWEHESLCCILVGRNQGICLLLLLLFKNDQCLYGIYYVLGIGLTTLHTLTM